MEERAIYYGTFYFMTCYIFFLISKNSLKSTEGRNPSNIGSIQKCPLSEERNEQESKKSTNDILSRLCADTQRYNILSTFLQRAPIGTSTSSKKSRISLTPQAQQNT
jgi:hypothetical protein